MDKLKGKIAVLGEHYFTLGFKLAGIQDVFQINDKDSLEQKLIELIDSDVNPQRQNSFNSTLPKPPGYAIILISEKLGEQMDWKLKKRISNLAYPVIVPLPDISGESTETANIKMLIKRALGFDLI